METDAQLTALEAARDEAAAAATADAAAAAAALAATAAAREREAALVQSQATRVASLEAEVELGACMLRSKEDQLMALRMLLPP